MEKTTAVLMICILCISFSFPVSNAAEISGTASDVTNYKQISSLVSDTWESDYFEKMIISPGSDSMEKDGEQESVSDEFNVSVSKAKEITKTENSMDSYLDRQDGIYEVEKNDDGDLEVTAPYQTKRIIVENDNVEDTYGASHVYVNKADGETILQYDAEEDTESAFEALKQTYGPSQCYLDKVVSLDETAMGLPLSQEVVDGVDSYSWGNDYMGMSKLKKEAASYGYTRKVTVAIVDTGINTSNRMFKGRTISSQSYNFSMEIKM